MKEPSWPRRPKPSLSWQHLSARKFDSGERWTVIWDTKRKAGSEGRNTAAERSEGAALDRARHLLRMGFVVYEIRDPAGARCLSEAEIRTRLGRAAESPDAAERPHSKDGDASMWGLSQDELANAMIVAHGDRAAGVARQNARQAATAGQIAAAKNWLRVIDLIQEQRSGALCVADKPITRSSEL